ncbi:MAG: LysR substrate-binding domain-containing protein [Caulobacterales bacterium]
MRHLPPIATLRALEAATRLRSYSMAARELNLTHGAVSHQLRRLEQDLGVALFRRVGNAMTPTPVAEALAARVASSLRDIEGALADASSAPDREPLVLSINSHFSGRWLAPRLPRLSAMGINLEIRVEDRLADLGADGVDAAVRQGDGAWPGFEVVPILPERLFPVCTPDFARQHGLREPADLARVPLLRNSMLPWKVWFDAMGLPEPPAEGLAVEDSSLIVDAALQDLGVALARSSLVKQELRHGRLIRPVPGEASLGRGFFLVWRADNRKRASIEALRDWMLAEASVDAQWLVSSDPA